jgi:steroid delta-isomerase
MDITAFIAAAEALDPQHLDRLLAFYADDCRFTDPFQSVSGQSAIQQIYADMFTHLHEPKFRDVHLMGAATSAPAEAVIGWTFEFAIGPGRPVQRLSGCSRLRFNAQGKIQDHTDFWDGSRLMQAFPVVGPVIGWLRRKIAHSSGG